MGNSAIDRRNLTQRLFDFIVGSQKEEFIDNRDISIRKGGDFTVSHV
jgi:hypothetical protein